MKDYLLHALAPEDFEGLVVQICLRVLGIGTISFSKGPDGGRDAIFIGKANQFPSTEAPWTGRFIVQAKSTSNPIASCSDPEFARILKDEIPRICALRANGECDNYVLFTNRKLSGAKAEQLTRYLQEKTGVANVAILGREVIASYLEHDPRLIHRLRTGVQGVTSFFQVPSPPADFTGRSQLIDELSTAVVRDNIRLVTLSGMGGVGKTAVALKLVDNCKEIFCDAQSFVDLGGLDNGQLSPRDVMTRTILSLHPQSTIPEKVDEIQGLYLSVLAKKRILLLLDNAGDLKQIAPLLPPSECLLIVTSRLRLAVPGSLTRFVDELPIGDACALLLKIAPRIANDASEIARICGFLPLALRLAGTTLAERPSLPVQRYAARLRKCEERLEAVDASIDLSYSLLDKALKSRWTMLSVFPAEFDEDAVASVWRCPRDESEVALGDLVRLSMVGWNDARRRFRLHKLLRSFADRHVSRLKRLRAGEAHSRHYSVVLARAAVADHDESIEAWSLGLATRVWAQIIYSSELDNITSGHEWACSRVGEDTTATLICSDYAVAGVTLHRRRKDPAALETWLRVGLDAARTIRSLARQGAILRELALLQLDQQEIPEAIALAEECLQVGKRTRNAQLQSDAFGILSLSYTRLRQDQDANAFSEKALDKAYEAGAWDLTYENPQSSVDTSIAERHFTNILDDPDPFLKLLGRRTQRFPLVNIVLAYVERGRYDKALACCKRGQAIAQDRGDKKRRRVFASLTSKIKALQKRATKTS